MAHALVSTPTVEDGHPRPVLLWWAVAAAAALHNTEEWLLDMTGWIADHPWLPGRSLHGDQAELGLVLLLVTSAIVGLALVAVVARPRWSATVLVCVAYALMANAASHVLLSVTSWSPMPGVLTGIAVLLPVGVLVTRTAPPVRWSVPTIGLTALGAVGITAGAFVLGALLTARG